MAQTIQNRYSDLNLDFLPHPITGDISILTDVAAVKQAVVNIVLTQHFETPFHPEIGCNVTTLLFENASVITGIGIRRNIQDVLRNFEPRISVQSIDVDINNDQNGFDVTVTFFVVNIPTLVTVDFFLTRLR